MKILTTILFIIAAGLCSESHAKNVDGEALLQSCNAATVRNPNIEQMVLGSFCLGLVQGVNNTHLYYRAKFKDRPAWVCMPDAGVRNEDVAEIVRTFLVNHPEQRSKDSSVLVTLALVDAFPCARNER